MTSPPGQACIFIPEQGGIPGKDRISVLFRQLQDCDRKYGSRNQNSYNLTAIFCELFSQLYLSGKRLSGHNGQTQLYYDITDYISMHLDVPVRVSEIAAHFGYNEKYITTFFKRMGGVPLKKYILTRKMEHAMVMLSDTNLTIAQIGYETGFSDNHNFSTAFKKVTGQSPTEYRNTYAQRKLFHE